MHISVSVSVSSNVPGFIEPTCIVNVDPKALVATEANRQAKWKLGEYEKTVHTCACEIDCQNDNEEKDGGTIRGRKSEANMDSWLVI